jgi:aryl-alcohol dehydrogenase-like predicted oxidoreductase
MNLPRLGSTDLQVSPIGLGLAALGRPGYINLGHAQDLEGRHDVPGMERRAHHVLDEAWRSGIRYFDAARSYGRAEQFLGSWLQSRNIPQAAVTVGSKWGYTYTAKWQVEAAEHEVKAHTLPVLQRQWQESRTNLGAYLRLYQIHSATLESGVLDNPSVLGELARLKEDGLYIGLSLSGPAQAEVLKRATDIELEGVRLFDCVQVTWNLLEPSTGPILHRVHRAGMGILVKEALANGRLTARNHEPAFAPKLALLEHQASRLHTTVDALALAAVLAQPWLDVVLSGAATIEQLRSNVKALEVPWDEEAESHVATLAEAPAAYWATRSELAWN